MAEPGSLKIVCRMDLGFAELSAVFRNVPGPSLVEATSFGDLEREIPDAQGLIIYNNRYTAEVAALIRRRGRALRWIQFATAGLDNAHKFGVPDGCVVCNAADVWAPTVAEHAMALLLGLVRQVHLFERRRQGGEGSREALAGGLVSLQDFTIAVVGVGSIGREFACRAKSFGCRLIGVTRTPREVDGFDECLPLDRLHVALAQADAVVLSIALTPETRHLVGCNAFAAMKESAILINVSRGDVVDEAALIEALQDGRLAGAGLDVFSVEPLPSESPLRRLPNVILSPHVAGFGAAKTVERLVDLCHDNIARFVDGRPLRNVVEI